MTRDRKTGMTLQQKDFAERYIANGGNGTQAALDAGYGSGNPVNARVRASEMLSKPKIRDYVLASKTAQVEAVKLDAQKVLSDIVEQNDVAMARKPIPGIDTDVYRYDAQAAKATSELLGRNLALFTDKVIHTISDEEVVHTVQRVLSRKLPPETVDALLTEIEAELISRK